MLGRCRVLKGGVGSSGARTTAQNAPTNDTLTRPRENGPSGLGRLPSLAYALPGIHSEHTMEGWVAVTHSDWFDFLATQPRREEVNFWSPSDYHTFRGTPGAPFFFKLTSPRNAIGGFGCVASFSRLPEWLAWECFAEGNGAATFADFKRRLDRIRERNKLRGASGLSQIGCIILVQAVFFSPEQWIPQPSDWAARNLRYQRYDLTTGEGARIWRECQERAATPVSAPYGFLVREQPERYGDPVLMRPRLGQGAFRVAVTDAYKRACAVTSEHSLPVLEAAHIVPYADGGAHDVSNGLLLRSDLHRLFDLGYVTVTPELRLEVSPRLRGDFENGRTYYPMHGGPLDVPSAGSLRPNPELLRWHNEMVFRS
jgi:putative restriction endonuclease